MKMTPEEIRLAQNQAKAKYDANHTVHFGIKLNVKTDFEILCKLAEQSSVQGYIKELIRADIKANPPILKYDKEPRGK